MTESGFIFSRLRLTLYAVITVMLMACSGGETGTGDNSGPRNPNASNNTTYIGPITAFGSIFVNGIEFDTEHALIESDGVEVEQSALTQGLLVKVDGQVDASGLKGVAYTVTYCSLLKGPIDSLLLDHAGAINGIKILGQTVRFDNNTLVDSNVAGVKTIQQLVESQFVEISGFQGLNEILATHVEVFSEAGGAQDALKVNGAIMELTSSYFRINDIVVRYDQNTAMEMMPSQLHTGVVVNVIGHYVNAQSGKQFYADQVEIDQHSASDKMLELEGYIVEPLNNGVMRVNRFPVVLSNEVIIKDGDIHSLQQMGNKLQLRGHIDQSGVIEAHEIKIQRASTVKFVSNIEQVDTDQNSIVVFARRILINNHTIVKDEREQGIQSINLSHFVVGDRVECDMQYDAELNEFVATQLRRVEPSSDPSTLKGPLLSVVGKGKNIVVNIAGLQLELANSDNHLFYSQPLGTIVNVTGSYNSLEDVFEVSKVEFSS